MADTTFLRRLQEYPKDTINGEIIDLLQPYLSHTLYTYEAAKTACGNVAGLIAWTIAMASFYEVNREVLPLKVQYSAFFYETRLIFTPGILRQIWPFSKLN